jgi:hypothetical protein
MLIGPPSILHHTGDGRTWANFTHRLTAKAPVNFLYVVTAQAPVIRCWALGYMKRVQQHVSRPTIRASRKSRMNPRHAAALALVGWYLIVPPIRWSVSGPPSIARDSTTMDPVIRYRNGLLLLRSIPPANANTIKFRSGEDRTLIWIRRIRIRKFGHKRRERLDASRPTIRVSRKSRVKYRHAAALALVGWYLMARRWWPHA